jgi:hypothetical protein
LEHAVLVTVSFVYMRNDVQFWLQFFCYMRNDVHFWEQSFGPMRNEVLRNEVLVAVFSVTREMICNFW